MKTFAWLKSWWSAVLLALAAVLWFLAPARLPGHGWRAWYFSNIGWQGEPRLVELIRYPDISADGNPGTSRQVNYSARFEAYLSVPAAGHYAFLLDSDDGSELYIDGERVLDNSGRHPRRQAERMLHLDAGVRRLRLDYFQGVVDSHLRLRWKRPGQENWSRIPLELLTPGPPDEMDQRPARRAKLWRAALFSLAGLLAAAAVFLFGFFNRQRLGEWFSPAWLSRKPLFWDVLAAAVCASIYLPQVLQRYGYEPYLIGDSPFYANVVASLLYEGNLDQRTETVQEDYLQARVGPNFGMHSSSISQGARGEWYPKHALLLPLAGLPFYAMWGGRGLLVFNVIQCLLLVVCMRRLAAVYCAPGAALAAAVLVGLSPLFVNYTYSFSADVLGAVLIAAGAAALFPGRALAGGLLLGLACLAKTPNVLAVLAAGLALLMTRERKSIFRFALGAGAMLIVLAGLNWYMFGAPWISGYSRVLVLEGGRLATDDHLRAFSRPLLEGIVWQLADQRFGLIQTAFFPALGLLGLYSLWKRRRPVAVMVAVFFLLTFLFYSVYDYLHGSHWGNRFLIPALSTLALPLGCMLEDLVISSSDGRRK